MGNNQNKIKKKENNSFSIELTSFRLKHPFVNYPEWSVAVLDKLRCRLIEKAAIAVYSQKTDNSTKAARTWAR